MKRAVVFAAVLVFAACNKNKFETVPQVKITSFGPKTVVNGNIIDLKADVTDKEGDAADSVIFYRKVISISSTPITVTDSIRHSLTDFAVPAKSQEYELEWQLLYGQQDVSKRYEYQPGNSVDRKFTIGVYVKDKAGNRSNYVESDTIVLKKI